MNIIIFQNPKAKYWTKLPSHFPSLFSHFAYFQDCCIFISEWKIKAAIFASRFAITEIALHSMCINTQPDFGLWGPYRIEVITTEVCLSSCFEVLKHYPKKWLIDRQLILFKLLDNLQKKNALGTHSKSNMFCLNITVSVQNIIFFLFTINILSWAVQKKIVKLRLQSPENN